MLALISLTTISAPFAELFALGQHPHSGGERGQRVPEIVAEDRDELLAEHGGFVLDLDVERPGLGVAGVDQPALVAATVHGLEQGEPSELVAAFGIALLVGIRRLLAA